MIEVKIAFTILLLSMVSGIGWVQTGNKVLGWLSVIGMISGLMFLIWGVK